MKKFLEKISHDKDTFAKNEVPTLYVHYIFCYIINFFRNFADSSVLSGYDTRLPGLLDGLNNSIKDPRNEEQRSHQSTFYSTKIVYNIY